MERAEKKTTRFDRKSPPFAERREGWGTLKFIRARCMGGWWESGAHDAVC
jgi:hypothetical protein